MHEDPDYKGPKEDCVEECKFFFGTPHFPLPRGARNPQLIGFCPQFSISNTAQHNAQRRNSLGP